ncbi:MAG: hypothetical protein A2722_01130 [Candidatus Doudnabacteria bacterium RIFCSPHIGHO2_01_FULL_50_11]|uniref:GlcNAc-PI de-N-acetylase n=1 Tax=Candidatus Doudnabacteria bacterium RIFCSPHIGHO2_01_FULL_50_11 TaxID=1817828 RepID=A0A1F5PFM9_9BACT|nr:MAG: hypothetical protein A2722_01130 [Candidatus Doudnabacteria bacterium RIFCSPHIGHO2_01_FULL_50_11]
MPSNSNEILGKRLLVVVAHPDDESFLVSGTTHENRRRGGVAWLICATAGEHGRAYLQRPVTPAQMKVIRTRELRAVAKHLGVARLFCLGLPDKGVEKRSGALRRRTTAIARDFHPDYILSFGPDGISGHTDHIATGLAARQAARKLHVPFLAFTLPPKLVANAHQWMRKRRKHGSYSDRIHYSKPTVKIVIVRSVKWKAMSLHRSQLRAGRPFDTIPRFAAVEFLKAEYFVSSKGNEDI